MSIRRRIVVLYLLMISAFSGVHAQPDSIRFSLLTCGPGQVVYELFGHTAIRYQNFTRQQDFVFNYGLFDFSTPNFGFRFALGQADYQLGVNSIQGFRNSYARRGSAVFEQELNLTAGEKERLRQLLFDNYRPENRVYRYNYFYNNCTTCARDQIERSVNGKVVYPEGEHGKSFRSIIHEYSKDCPWDRLGMDLLLGAEADREIDSRQQMFAPFYMRHFASLSIIVSDDGQRRPLVLRETKLVDVPSRAIEPGFPLSPMACGYLFLLLNLFIAYCQFRKRRIYWGWDILLYGAQGIAGCIVAFLFFFSTHPTVDSNMNILLLNPVPLLLLPYILYTDLKRRKNIYFAVKTAYLTFFIVFIFFSFQDFNLSVLPLALSLWVNSISHLLVYNKR